MGNRKQPTPAPGPGFKPDPPAAPPTCRAPPPPSGAVSIPQGAGRVVPYLDLGTAILIGSALVHADELLSSLKDSLAGRALLLDPFASQMFDIVALRAALDTAHVQEWLASFPPGLLPVKRGGP